MSKNAHQILLMCLPIFIIRKLWDHEDTKLLPSSEISTETRVETLDYGAYKTAKQKILGRHQLFKSEISALQRHLSITYCLRYVAPRFQYVEKFTSGVEYSLRRKSEFIDALIRRAYSSGAFPRDAREPSCRPTHFQVLPNCSSPLREEPVPTAVGRSLLSAI
jgi:hypothetical protein